MQYKRTQTVNDCLLHLPTAYFSIGSIYSTRSVYFLAYVFGIAFMFYRTTAQHNNIQVSGDSKFACA